MVTWGGFFPRHTNWGTGLTAREAEQAEQGCGRLRQAGSHGDGRHGDGAHARQRTATGNGQRATGNATGNRQRQAVSWLIHVTWPEIFGSLLMCRVSCFPFPSHVSNPSSLTEPHSQHPLPLYPPLELCGAPWTTKGSLGPLNLLDHL